MKKRDLIRIAARTAVAGTVIAAGAYATLIASAWVQFGRAPRPRRPAEEDPLLDAFVPAYDIVERHHIHVQAPATVTLACARNINLTDACLSRAIFKAREVVLRGQPAPQPEGGLVPAMQSIGWGVLADGPGLEIVLGAVTRPWEPNPVFRGVPRDEFARFNEPGFVKIAFTLRADPAGDSASIFRTETRAIATDTEARRLFRRYWSIVSPGVALIRFAMLKPVKAAAEAAAAPHG